MSSSRLNYLGNDAPGGGKRSRKSGAGPRTRHEPPQPSVNGVPGPEARRLDISEIIRTVGMHYRHRFAVPPDPDIPATELSATAPTTGELTLTNAGEALILRGKAHGVLRMECSRCLTSFEQGIDFDLEEEFDLVTEHNAFRQEEVRAVDENVTAPVIDGAILDLGELLRQSLLLSAPLQPLCREDCAGIGTPTQSAEQAPSPPETHRPLEALGALWQARDAGDPE